MSLFDPLPGHLPNCRRPWLRRHILTADQFKAGFFIVYAANLREPPAIIHQSWETQEPRFLSDGTYSCEEPLTLK